MGRHIGIVRLTTACAPRRVHRHAEAWRAAAIGMAALALAGCSSFGSSQPDKPVEPNVFPADYKTGLMTFLQTNPFGLVGAREAALSAPELKAFGNENRYVACMRVAGPDWRKDKMVVYFGGAINQFVDAGEQCNGAAYQPFPELPAMFAQLRSGK
jgi:hypothetical protein